MPFSKELKKTSQTKHNFTTVVQKKSFTMMNQVVHILIIFSVIGLFLSTMRKTANLSVLLYQTKVIKLFDINQN